jgi:hypothetical protein
MLWINIDTSAPGFRGYRDGTFALGQSEAVNANTWEVLLATFSVKAVGIASPGQTRFNVGWVPLQKSGSFLTNGLNFYQDGSTTQDHTATVGQGIIFETHIPEPGSLCLLALGVAMARGISRRGRRRRVRD